MQFHDLIYLFETSVIVEYIYKYNSVQSNFLVLVKKFYMMS